MTISTTAIHAPIRTEIRYAGFWRRVLAYLIDQVFLFGVELAIYWGASVLAPDTLQAIEGGSLQTVAGIGFVGFTITWAYFAIMESSPAGGTLGKLALGLYVGDVHGDPITFRRARYRYLLKYLSSLPLGAGYLLAGFTPRKQALHDMLAGTLVLRKVHYLELGPQPPTEPGDHWDGTRWVASVPPMERS